MAANILAQQALTCSPPSELLKVYPCLACLSEKELLAVIVLSMAQASPLHANNVALLLSDSACFTCLSKKQRLQALAALLGNMGLGTKTVPEIRDAIKCLLCGTPNQLWSAALFLYCNYFQQVAPQ